VNGYRAILEKEIVEAWRSYRIAVVCGLFVVLGIALPVVVNSLSVLSGLFGQVDPTLVIDQTGVPDVVEVLVRSLWQLGAVAGVLLAMGSIATERASGTLAFVLAKPIGRGTFVWAKFVALAMILGLATALAVLAAWLYVALLFERQSVVDWAQLWLLAWLSALVYGAITLAASSAVRSPAGAAAIGFTAFGVVSLASTVVTLNSWLPSGLAEVAQAIVLGEVGPDLDPGRTVVASGAVIVVALAVAWLRFRREDL
jgi:ABC-2 type transport system permease protein